ncbi:MAG: hypothetical protein WC657_07935 [Candidatus Paceibacterota bacterium]|jgi:hypothetical protein
MKEHGSLFYSLKDCAPMSVSQEKWEKDLDKALKKDGEEWCAGLFGTGKYSLIDLGWVIEQLALRLDVAEAIRDSLAVKVGISAPCPVCHGHKGPYTCGFCRGTGLDPNFRAS